MRLGWSVIAWARRISVGSAIAALSTGMLACSEDNPGNFTPPPPPTEVASSLGGSVSSTGGSSGSSSNGGSSNGGTAGSGLGGPGDVSKPWASSGCGKQPPADQIQSVPGERTGYTEYHVQQTGATLGTDVLSDAGDRQFFVRLPVDYNPDHPYKVVYIGQGCGAAHAGKDATYPLFNTDQGGDDEAIYIGLSVADNNPNPGCYDNNSGPQSLEWEAFDLIQTFMEQTFCVDNNRIYVAGYSTGGWLGDMWACYFGGTSSPPLDQQDVAAGRQERKFSPHWAVRGRVGVSGSLPDNQPVPCNGPFAGLWIHDTTDTGNLLATNIAAINLALTTDGCTGNYNDGPKEPWPPAENIPGLAGGICQQYTGCPADVLKNYPLVFCTTSIYGHGSQDANAIPAFTAFFRQLDPTP